MSGSKLKEMARLGLLGVVSAWLLHPFATARMYGAGDALWYEHMLADFVIQLRAGVFPVFAGQTEYAFNGAVYPLRVAPLYQHLAGLIDLLTGRSLGFVSLQHLEVIICGTAGIYACYFTLCAVAPERRWSAAALATLYLSCPGILATIYTQDLYMTWMAVPLAPLAAFGIVRTFRKDDLASQMWLAAPLAALWWAHAPIALWFTFVAASSQIVRLGANAGTLPGSWGRAIFGILVFAVLAQYPFVSVAAIKTPGVETSIIGSLARPDQVMEFIRSAFPASLLPLSNDAAQLSDLQLGYGFWLILATSVFALVWNRRLEAAVLIASAFLLLLLVLPVPGITGLLWHLVPASVVRITYYWPMQRFYLICAALLAAAGQISVDSALRRAKVTRVGVSFVLLAGCSWSLFESRQFLRAARQRTSSAEATAMAALPENIVLMDHAYGLFPKLPRYFSNGVVDPRSQVRLFPLPGGAKPAGSGGIVVASGRLTGHVDTNPGILDLDPGMRIEPGMRYELQLTFAHGGVPGILQLRGHSMFREYALPSSGESLAFGSAPGNGNQIDLWTSSPTGDLVAIRFIPILKGSKAEDFSSFGSFVLLRLGSEALSNTSLMPFDERVSTAAGAILETPRVYAPGYSAAVDGVCVPATRSDEGLVEVRVPAGTHRVSLSFKGPASLRISYWLAVAAWITCLGVAPFLVARPRNSGVRAQ